MFRQPLSAIFDEPRLRRLAAGAALSAILGSSAGAALRPEAPERGDPPAPQQIYLAQAEIAALERQADGWPARAQQPQAPHLSLPSPAG